MADEFKIELIGVKKALEMFDPEKVRKAAIATMNRTAATAKTEASKIIRQDYNVRAARLSQYLRLTARARGNMLEATISGRGLGMALAYFDPRQAGKRIKYAGRGKERRGQLTSRRARGGDLSVLVKRGGGRKIVTGKYGNKPFLTQMKTGHIGVYVRTGSARKPIEQLLGPGVGGLFGSRRIMTAVTARINKYFGPEFKHQLDYYLGRLK